MLELYHEPASLLDEHNPSPFFIPSPCRTLSGRTIRALGPLTDGFIVAK